MKQLRNFSIVLALTAQAALTACSLTPIEKPYSLRINFDTGVAATSLTSSARSSANLTTPTQVSDFTCLGVFVSGDQIPANTDLAGYCSIQMGANMPRPGIIGGLVPATGGTVSLKVPGGLGRLIQVFGVQSNNGQCPDFGSVMTSKSPSSANFGSFYELGRATQDLFSDSSVAIKASFSSTDAASKLILSCSGGGSGGGGNSTPTIASISPSAGSFLGGTPLTITGTGFVASPFPTVTLSTGSPVSCPVTGATATSVTCTTPAHVAGTATVVVTNNSGTASSAFSGFQYSAPTRLLGQTTQSGIGTTSGGSTSATGMATARQVASDGVHLAVVDSGNSRVLLWNSIPTSLDQAADVVLGQPAMNGWSANQGGSAAAGTLNNPTGVGIYNGKVVVADSTNNRSLIWNTWPTTNGQNADYVIGQANFTATAGSCAAAIQSTPTSVAISETGALYITELGNNRIDYYSSIPAGNGVNPTYYIGQANGTACASASTQSGLAGPYGVAASGSYVAVADQTGNRVLTYNVPTSNGQNALRVLGEPNFTTTTGGSTQAILNGPAGVFIRGTSLYVADTSNSRIMYWSNIATVTNGQNADQVFGQPDFVTVTGNTGGASYTSLQNPYNVYSDAAGYLWVGDTINNRVTVNPWY